VRHTPLLPQTQSKSSPDTETERDVYVTLHCSTGRFRDELGYLRMNSEDEVLPVWHHSPSPPPLTPKPEIIEERGQSVSSLLQNLNLLLLTKSDLFLF
jgi:hypothetical protein